METQSIIIPTTYAKLEGNLTIPEESKSIIVFVHGSGSSRFSPRNTLVANALNKQGYATLLFDLLTPIEENEDQFTQEFRFNIALLAKRLIEVTDWLQNHSETSSLELGYFGASTGAGAALVAAAHYGDMIKAVVSRGGRPDLADDALLKVTAPTLLIVGGLDDVVLVLNKKAKLEMQCETELEIIDGATHLFEEPGTLEQVVAISQKWFERFLNKGK